MNRKPRMPSRRSFLQTSMAAGAVATITGAPLIAKGAAKTVIKMGSLAPANSSWGKAFKALAAALNKETDGAVQAKLYLGGSLGSEKAMVEKARKGQLDAVAVTSVGLGTINKQLLAVQLPMLFANYKQVDRVRGEMKSTFDKLLDDAGFRIGGYGDVGFAYLFSHTPVKTPGDAARLKISALPDDDIMRATLKTIGANPETLDVADVLPALNTGMIDSFVASPYAAVALQWVGQGPRPANTVTNLRLAFLAGAAVITKRAWEKLGSEEQAVRDRLSEQMTASLTRRIRSDNEKAIGALKKKGLKVVEPDNYAEWANVAAKVRNKLSGKVFDEALVDKIVKATKT